jgi:hypothetical protein
MLIFITVLAAVFIAAASYLIFNNSKYRRFQGACDSAFDQVYSTFHPKPSLEHSNSYGFPNFTVMFDSKNTSERAASEGLNALFKERIAEICRGRGSTERPFNADLAVGFGYPGHIQDRIRALQLRKEVIITKSIKQ